MRKIINIFIIISFLVGSIFTLIPSQAFAEDVSFSFAKQFESTDGYSYAYSTTLDQDGNIYTAGYFQGTVDFDPDEGTQNLTSASGSSAFISKLDSDGNLVFVKQFSGENSSSYANSITLDEEGNIYTAGYFNGTVDFDPGAGTYELTSNNNYAFILKLNSNGEFVFAKPLESTNNGQSQINSITLDGEGNIYTTGYFNNTVDFDLGEGIHALTSMYSSSVFISKLDSDGNFVFARPFENGENGSSGANSIILDDQGNIYTTGYFGGTVDFDPDSGTQNLISANNNYSTFVSKLNSAGNFVFAKQFVNGEDSSSGASSITLDNQGNIYTTGYFSGTVDFDPSEEGIQNLTNSTNNNSAFISKLDKDSNFVFVKQFVNGENGYSDIASVTSDDQGNIYTTGYFGGTVDFDPSEEIYELTGCIGECGDVFISKLDSNGNFIFVKQFENEENSGSGASSVTLDQDGNIYTVGSFGGTVDFDPGAGTQNLTSTNMSAFISKLSQPQEESTPSSHSHIRSSGSSPQVIASFQLEQQQRAINAGLDPTQYQTGTSTPSSNQEQQSPLSFSRILKLTTPRMQGDDIKQLQTYLNTHGYDCGTPDGTFGLKTKLAVIAFQLANQLKGDGVVGLMTQALLK